MNRPAVFVGVLFAVLLHAGIAGGIYYEWHRSCKPGDTRPHCECVPPNDKHPRCIEKRLAKMKAIEVEVARKSQTESKQPQKPRSQKRKKKAVKVAEDAPETPQKDQPEDAEPEVDYEEMAEQFMQDDAEQDSDTETDLPGKIDGHEYGLSDVDKGHPYMRELKALFNKYARVPKFARSKGTVLGCMRIVQEGTAEDSKVWETEANQDVVRSVRLGLKDLVSYLAENPHPVEDDLLWRKISQKYDRWICFRVTAK